MIAFIAAFFIALAITLAGLPWVRRAALALDLVDAPAQRKVHRTPMPLLGGAGIFLGAILGVLIIYRGNPEPTVIGVLLAATVVALTGLMDDYRPLPAWAKLGGQIAGFAILVAFGIRVRLPLPEVVDYAITLLWLVGITNAINFLDNMDGLSAGIAGVTSSFILLLALTNGQFLVATLSAALLGASWASCATTSRRRASSWATLARSFWAFYWRSWASSCASPTTPTSSPGWCLSSCSGCPSST